MPSSLVPSFLFALRSGMSVVTKTSLIFFINRSYLHICSGAGGVDLEQITWTGEVEARLSESPSLPPSSQTICLYPSRYQTLSASLSRLVHPARSPEASRSLPGLGTITKAGRRCACERLARLQPMGIPVSEGQRLSTNGSVALTAGPPGRGLSGSRLD